MGVANTGNQQITFKYSTPLRADYLNIMMNDLSSEGLCSRPKIDIGIPTDKNVHVFIHEFSLLVHPLDNEKIEDENNIMRETRMVKVSTTSVIDLVVYDSDVAIGFKYRLTPEDGSGTSVWYGDFVSLPSSDVSSFDGIIIATVVTHVTGTAASPTLNFGISTQGADISDVLLREEGWNCNRWVSLISPRRLDGGTYDRIELRNHNNAFEGYMNGHIGCVYQGGNKVGSIPVSLEFNKITMGGSEKPNDWGIIQNELDEYKDFTLVKHNSEGLNFAQQGNEFPIEETDGGIVAVIEADATNEAYRNTEYTKTFSNYLKIKPCIQEKINMYFKDDGTWVIR